MTQADNIWDDMLEISVSDWNRVEVTTSTVVDILGYARYQIKDEVLEWGRTFIADTDDIRLKIYTNKTRFWFRHKKDAMAFKLAWGGQ